MHDHMHYHIRYKLISNHCWAPHWTTFKGPEIQHPAPPWLSGPFIYEVHRVSGAYHGLEFIVRGHVSRQGMTRPSKHYTSYPTKSRIHREQTDIRIVVVIPQVLLRSEKTGKQDAWLEECYAFFAREIQMGRCLSNSKAFSGL